MPGRVFSNGNDYRFSFNGQEKTPEITPNSTTAEFWQYDARLGRRWNVDPVIKVEESPYLCFSGNPILLNDRNGDNAKGPGPRIPNFKLPKSEVPVFMGDFEFPEIHNIDLEYSKTERGKQHSITFKIPTGTVTLLVMTAERDPSKVNANRIASKNSNPTQIGNRSSNTAGHEVPYASTQQGGAFAMRKITDATQNSEHGTRLQSFYKEFNLQTGDVFVVALFEPTSNLPSNELEPQKEPGYNPQAPVILPMTQLPKSTVSPRIPTPTGTVVGGSLLRRIPMISFVAAMWDAFEPLPPESESINIQ